MSEAPDPPHQPVAETFATYQQPVREPGQASAGTRPAPAGPPTTVNGYPVMAAVATDQDATSWIVICRRTERMPDWATGTAWYVTWRSWWDGHRWTGENGDYGPHHGLTWPQAQRSLLSRLNLPAAKPDPAVYLVFGEHTDTWNCPACRQPITEVYDRPTLGELHTAVAAHRCPAEPTSTHDPVEPDQSGDER
jgi:hypothetical protein